MRMSKRVGFILEVISYEYSGRGIKNAMRAEIAIALRVPFKIDETEIFMRFRSPQTTPREKASMGVMSGATIMAPIIVAEDPIMSPAVAITADSKVSI